MKKSVGAIGIIAATLLAVSPMVVSEINTNTVKAAATTAPTDNEQDLMSEFKGQFGDIYMSNGDGVGTALTDWSKSNSYFGYNNAQSVYDAQNNADFRSLMKTPQAKDLIAENSDFASDTKVYVTATDSKGQEYGTEKGKTLQELITAMQDQDVTAVTLQINFESSDSNTDTKPITFTLNKNTINISMPDEKVVVGSRTDSIESSADVAKSVTFGDKDSGTASLYGYEQPYFDQFSDALFLQGDESAGIIDKRRYEIFGREQTYYQPINIEITGKTSFVSTMDLKYIEKLNLNNSVLLNGKIIKSYTSTEERQNGKKSVQFIVGQSKISSSNANQGTTNITVVRTITATLIDSTTTIEQPTLTVGDDASSLDDKSKNTNTLMDKSNATEPSSIATTVDLGDTYYTSPDAALNGDSTKKTADFSDNKFTKDGSYYRTIVFHVSAEDITDHKFEDDSVTGKSPKVDTENNTVTYVQKITVNPKASSHHSSGSSSSSSNSSWKYTPIDNENYVTTKTDAEYYKLYDNSNQVITDRALDMNTSWKINEKRVLNNGLTQYRVATNEWINADDVNYDVLPIEMTLIDVENNSGIVNVDSTDEYYRLYNYDVKEITDRALGKDTSWKFDKIAKDFNDNTYYRVATNEWVKASSGVSVSSTAEY